MSVTSELSHLITAHQLLSEAKTNLLAELDNLSFANNEARDFVQAIARYTHDPRAVNLLSDLYDEGITKWNIGAPCPTRFIDKPSPNPSIVFEVRPINGTEPVTLILNVGLTDYTPNVKTTIDDIEYVVIPSEY